MSGLLMFLVSEIKMLESSIRSQSVYEADSMEQWSVNCKVVQRSMRGLFWVKRNNIYTHILGG